MAGCPWTLVIVIPTGADVGRSGQCAEPVPPRVPRAKHAQIGRRSGPCFWPHLGFGGSGDRWRCAADSERNRLGELGVFSFILIPWEWIPPPRCDGKEFVND